MTPLSLDAPDIVEFIRANHRVFLFCRDGARRPIGYAMRSVAYHPATRSLAFTTYAKSAKVRHLQSAPEVACLIGDDEGWVSVSGVAHVYQPSATEVDELIGERSPDQRVPDAVVTKVRDRLLTGKRCVIGLTLTEVRAAAIPDRHA
ncbi:pyridoxamine 5'-phosphate oxidase family protein [Mycobacterium helveticum]|uniref:Pyridoxamine 5'-phosphate oxidase family protein n=1 Tax=Mycobacterium helveticum TaxID=2592811 RepID=A0A557Y0T4_9MYCO|nr:pyridoxamine 5'-phosphate oxidase family protein [Mycobacterium helveticum]TVS90066.1 pyridoxamine 5'-phosphate oxidase family protein [Mycobacterium helveticum]TVS92173.1 pyridoxamine 5'-phosphate oxidase family protein [Mycobacterium helveticum]